MYLPYYPNAITNPMSAVLATTPSLISTPSIVTPVSAVFSETVSTFNSLAIILSYHNPYGLGLLSLTAFNAV